MEQKILWDLYCFQCSLQFDKRSLYDQHLLIIHNYKNRTETAIESKPEEREMSIVTSNIQPEQVENQELIKNEGKKSLECETSGYKCSQKESLEIHFLTLHEGKKPFKCEFCNNTFSQKRDLKIHIAPKKTQGGSRKIFT